MLNAISIVVFSYNIKKNEMIVIPLLIQYIFMSSYIKLTNSFFLTVDQPGTSKFKWWFAFVL